MEEDRRSPFMNENSQDRSDFYFDLSLQLQAENENLIPQLPPRDRGDSIVDTDAKRTDGTVGNSTVCQHGDGDTQRPHASLERTCDEVQLYSENPSEESIAQKAAPVMGPPQDGESRTLNDSTRASSSPPNYEDVSKDIDAALIPLRQEGKQIETQDSSDESCVQSVRNDHAVNSVQTLHSLFCITSSDSSMTNSGDCTLKKKLKCTEMDERMHRVEPCQNIHKDQDSLRKTDDKCDLPAEPEAEKQCERGQEKNCSVPALIPSTIVSDRCKDASKSDCNISENRRSASCHLSTNSDPSLEKPALIDVCARQSEDGTHLRTASPAEDQRVEAPCVVLAENESKVTGTLHNAEVKLGHVHLSDTTVDKLYGTEESDPTADKAVCDKNVEDCFQDSTCKSVSLQGKKQVTESGKKNERNEIDAQEEGCSKGVYSNSERGEEHLPQIGRTRCVGREDEEINVGIDSSPGEMQNASMVVPNSMKANTNDGMIHERNVHGKPGTKRTSLQLTSSGEACTMVKFTDGTCRYIKSEPKDEIEDTFYCSRQSEEENGSPQMGTLSSQSDNLAGHQEKLCDLHIKKEPEDSTCPEIQLPSENSKHKSSIMTQEMPQGEGDFHDGKSHAGKACRVLQDSEAPAPGDGDHGIKDIDSLSETAYDSDGWQIEAHKQEESDILQTRTRQAECDYESSTFERCPMCRELIASNEAINHAFKCKATPSLEPNQPGSEDAQQKDMNCPECGVKFHKEDDLKMHINIHTMLTQNAIRQNSTMIKMASQMQMDKSTETTCEVCLESFADPTMAPYHAMMHKTFPFHCRKCNIFFTKLDELHKTRCDDKKRHKVFKYHCKKCMRVLLNSHRMRRHCGKCVGRVETCRLCKEKFSTFQELARHAEMCNPDVKGVASEGKKAEEAVPMEHSNEVDRTAFVEGVANGVMNCTTGGSRCDRGENKTQTGDNANDLGRECKMERCVEVKGDNESAEVCETVHPGISYQDSKELNIITHNENTYEAPDKELVISSEGESQRTCRSCGRELQISQEKQTSHRTADVCNDCGSKIDIFETNTERSTILPLSLTCGRKTSHKRVIQLPDQSHRPAGQPHYDPNGKKGKKRAFPSICQSAEEANHPHSETKRKKAKKREICGACGDSFKNFKRLEEHAANCDGVLKSSAVETAFSKPPQQHDNEINLDWRCPTKAFKRHHCPKCNKAFHMSKKLRRHIKLCRERVNHALSRDMIDVCPSGEDNELSHETEKQSRNRIDITGVSCMNPDTGRLQTSPQTSINDHPTNEVTNLPPHCKALDEQSHSRDSLGSTGNFHPIMKAGVNEDVHMTAKKTTETAGFLNTSEIRSTVASEVQNMMSMCPPPAEEDTSLESPSSPTLQKQNDLHFLKEPNTDINAENKALPRATVHEEDSVPYIRHSQSSISAEANSKSLSYSSINHNTSQVGNGHCQRPSGNIGGVPTGSATKSPSSLDDQHSVLSYETGVSTNIDTTASFSSENKSSTSCDTNSTMHERVPMVDKNIASVKTQDLESPMQGLISFVDTNVTRMETKGLVTSIQHQVREIDGNVTSMDTRDLGSSTVSGSECKMEESSREPELFPLIQEEVNISQEILRKEASIHAQERSQLPTPVIDHTDSVTTHGKCVAGDHIEHLEPTFVVHPATGNPVCPGYHCVYCSGEFQSKDELWKHAEGCRDDHLMLIASQVQGKEEFELIETQTDLFRVGSIPFRLNNDYTKKEVIQLRDDIGIDLSNVQPTIGYKPSERNNVQHLSGSGKKKKKKKGKDKKRDKQREKRKDKMRRVTRESLRFKKELKNSVHEANEKKHPLNKRRPQPKFFVCELCKRMFQSKERLERHRQHHVNCAIKQKVKVQVEKLKLEELTEVIELKDSHFKCEKEKDYAKKKTSLAHPLSC